jgi:hypothetical protein
MFSIFSGVALLASLSVRLSQHVEASNNLFLTDTLGLPVWTRRAERHEITHWSGERREYLVQWLVTVEPAG